MLTCKQHSKSLQEANVTYCGKGFIPSLNYMTSIMSLLTFILFKFITQNY